MKTLVYGFVSIALVNLMPACSPRDTVAEALWNDSLAFDPGFPLSGPLMGVFRNSDLHATEEYVYFADAVTAKRLLFYSPQGKLAITVPLDEALDSIGHIGGLSVIHPDTILLCSVYTNKICTLDREGHCRSVLDLSDHLILLNGLSYELWNSSTTPFLSGESACFEGALVGETIDRYSESDAPAGGGAYTYYWLARNGPHLVAFDLNSDIETSQPRWGPVYTTTDTLSAIPATPEVGAYAILNGLCFQFSMYSPVIHILDPATMRLLDQFEVHSALGSTYCDPIMVPKHIAVELQDSISDRLRSGGTIQSIRFDYPTKRYLVILLQRSTGQITESKDLTKYAYSILEYDSVYHLVKERSITDGEHSLPLMLNLSSGTYVLRSESKREKIRGIHTFDRFVLDGN